MSVPPVPFRSKLLSGVGTLTPVWQDWFNKVFVATKDFSTSGSPSPPAVTAPTVTGSYSSPISVSAASGIGVVADTAHEVRYVASSGGEVNITANPQIEAGSTNGQVLKLVGTSDSDVVVLDNGDGLALNGSCRLVNRAIITLIWDSEQSVWQEETRNDMA